MSHLTSHNARLANILFIIRHANLKHNIIADNFRRSLNFSHHARQYASAIGLRINVAKAVACAQCLVAAEPLPIIDTTPTPISPIPRATQKKAQPIIPPIVIPAANSRRRKLSSLSPSLSYLPNLPSSSCDTLVHYTSEQVCGVPGAPKIVPMELCENEEEDRAWMNSIQFTPIIMSPSSDCTSESSSGPGTPDNTSKIVLRIRLPAKRKFVEDETQDITFESPRQQLKNRWSKAQSHRHSVNRQRASRRSRHY